LWRQPNPAFVNNDNNRGEDYGDYDDYDDEEDEEDDDNDDDAGYDSVVHDDDTHGGHGAERRTVINSPPTPPSVWSLKDFDFPFHHHQAFPMAATLDYPESSLLHGNRFRRPPLPLPPPPLIMYNNGPTSPALAAASQVHCHTGTSF
jgi:hypothetical protein